MLLEAVSFSQIFRLLSLIFGADVAASQRYLTIFWSSSLISQLNHQVAVFPFLSRSWIHLAGVHASRLIASPGVRRHVF